MKSKNKTLTVKLAKAALCIAAAVSSLGMNAQEESKGKAIITVFPSFGTTFHNTSDKVESMGFNLERAYLGYQYQLSSSFSAKVVYDMGKGDDNSIQRMGYVKNAQLDYKNGGLSISAGLTSTKEFGLQEKFWGERYIMKSYMDENKWASSADLGITAEYKFADFISADASIFNGEGYKKIQADDQLLYGIGVTAEPVKNLYVRAYAETKTQRDASNQNTFAFFAGYKDDNMAFGCEYNMMFNNKYHEDRNLTSLSVYGRYKVCSNTEVFARYDNGSSDAADGDVWSYSQDGSSAIAGVDMKINKLLHIGPNVRWSHNDAADKDYFSVMLNAQIKL